MKRKILIILVLLLLITGCESGENNKKNITFDENFAISFLKIEDNKNNIIYSPLSIKYAIKMLNEGAAGKTKEEIESLIKDLNLTKYNNIEQKLSLANAIYIRDSYKENIKSSYIDKLTREYNAEVHYDKFTSVDGMNKFIEEKTFGIIKKMLTDDSINDNTKMVLINALAIDMKWVNNFSGNYTYGENFTLDDGTIVNATTMHKNRTKSNDVSFYKDDNITALTMDLEKYDDVQLEFMAIMPHTSISKYIENFEVEEFENIKNKSTLASNTSNGVNISIPKFEYEYSLKLKDDLNQMGIKEAFDAEKANFSEITTDPRGLFVSDALHKAKIEFSEDGIKAAAVTVIMAEASSIMLDKPEEVKIDKPFLYAIRDKANGEIWFIGTVYQPNLWKNDMNNY